MELTYVTAGESHGPGLTVVVSGVPAGVELDHELIRRDLARRQAGYGRSPRQKLEQDDVRPLGGIRHGRALGSPIAFFIENRDHKNWTHPMSAWPVTSEELEEYGWRGKPIRLPGPGTPTSRASSSTGTRTCATCWSAPAPARRPPGSPPAPWPRRSAGRSASRCASHVLQVGTVRATPPAWLSIDDFERAERSEVRCLDPTAEAAMIAEIEAAKKERDTLGGVTEVRAFNVPPGLGSHVSAGRAARRPDRRGHALDPVREGRRDRRRDRLGRPPRGRASTTRSCTPATPATTARPIARAASRAA